jgi:hypothetical protein
VRCTRTVEIPLELAHGERMEVAAGSESEPWILTRPRRRALEARDGIGSRQCSFRSRVRPSRSSSSRASEVRALPAPSSAAISGGTTRPSASRSAFCRPRSSAWSG